MSEKQDRSLTDRQIGTYVQQAAGASSVTDPGVLAAAMEVLLAIEPRTDKPRWCRYIHPADRRKYQWKDFRTFCEKHLETTPEALEGYLASFPALRRRVDKEAKGRALEVAAKVKVAAVGPSGVHRGVGITDTTRIGKDNKPAQMARLRRDRPDLADEVASGEKSVGAAVVEAGWRPRYVSIRVDSADEAIRALLRHLTRKELEDALAKLGPTKGRS